MSYSIKIIRKEDQKTTEWSGGSTTQLAIYPGNAEYSQRNFRWRISTATMKVENSLFTNLPGYWRLLMATDGEFTLEHQGQHTVRLQPFEQDAFNGEWTTRCLGKGDDFNVMLASECTGELKALSIDDSFHETLQYNKDLEYSETFECVYVNNGIVNVTIDDKLSVLLDQSDLLIYKNEKNDRHLNITYMNLKGHSNKKANVIRITIHQEMNV